MCDYQNTLNYSSGASVVKKVINQIDEWKQTYSCALRNYNFALQEKHDSASGEDQEVQGSNLGPG